MDLWNKSKNLCAAKLKKKKKNKIRLCFEQVRMSYCPSGNQKCPHLRFKTQCSCHDSPNPVTQVSIDIYSDIH